MAAFTALEKLHEKGIVHSDVSTTDGIVKFIDFDLAGKVGETYPKNYPKNYNHLSGEHHPDAQAEEGKASIP